MGLKFGVEVDSSTPKFTPSVQCVAPAGDKLQNRPLNNSNTGECAERKLLVKYNIEIDRARQSHCFA